MIDRISPTQRPTGRPVQTQKWEKLLFLHWQVPEQQLRNHVPDELSIDMYDGHAYVGVVPFVMSDVRPTWWPRSLAFNFLETNVRTYVHHNGIPGVYFFSLDASSRLAVWMARNIWGLPYHFADMSFQQEDEHITYQTTRCSQSRAQQQVDYRIGSEMGTSSEESLEFFLLERYAMFAGGKRGMQIGYVHHAPYEPRKVEQLRFNHNSKTSDDSSGADHPPSLLDAAGFDLPSTQPFCAHYVESVQADIFPLQQSQ